MKVRLAQYPSHSHLAPGESPGRFLRGGAIWRIRFLLLVLACGVFPAAASAKAFVHPGILRTREDLRFVKSKVAAREEPWFSAWTNLLSQATASLNFTGKPSAYLGDHDNGNNVVPGPGLLHNLVLMRSQDCVVRHSRLDDSPHGQGVDIVRCENVEIADSEIARNRLHGIHAVESSRLRILGNLAEGSDASGIACDRWMDACRSVRILGNIARNNRRSGISVLGASDKIVKNNQVTDNGP